MQDWFSDKQGLVVYILFSFPEWEYVATMYDNRMYDNLGNCK